MRPLTIGSLFSGIGGLELGLERGLAAAGVPTRTLWQVEQNDYARAVLARHWPHAERYTDVRDITAETVQPINLLAGGFPCQDISTAGKGAGLAGKRSGLFFEMARIIRELRPRIVVMENVPAITTRGLDTVLGTLAALGYDARWGGLRASEVGAPHRRERWFCVAWLADPQPDRFQGRTLAGGVRQTEGETKKERDQRQRHGPDSMHRGQERLVEPCDACGESWCLRCEKHWVICGCPGIHEGDVIDDCPAHVANHDRQRGEARTRLPAGAGSDLSDPDRGDWSGSGMADHAPLWQRCDCCENYWCNRHQQHAHDCDCPSIEHLDIIDPYTSGSLADSISHRLQGQQPARTATGAAHRADRAGKWWQTKSGMGRNAARIPGGLVPHRWPAPPGPQHPWEPPRTRPREKHDRDRLKALGNAVVPQCAEVIGRWIGCELVELL